MVRPKREDRSTIQDTTLTLRLSKEDRETLARLVARETAELADRGIEVTAASYVRGLIRREAKSLDLTPARPAEAPSTVGHAPAPTAEPSIAATPPEAPAPPPPKPPHAASSPDGVRERLLRAVTAGHSQAAIARTAKPPIDPGQLSRFSRNAANLSTDKLRSLDAALRGVLF